MLRDLVLQHFPTLFAVCDVETEQTPVTPVGDNGVQRFLSARGVTVIVNANVKAVCRQLAGDGATNAFAGTGNQN